jgi:hypothetical protein
MWNGGIMYSSVVQRYAEERQRKRWWGMDRGTSRGTHATQPYTVSFLSVHYLVGLTTNTSIKVVCVIVCML